MRNESIKNPIVCNLHVKALNSAQFNIRDLLRILDYHQLLSLQMVPAHNEIQSHSHIHLNIP